MRYYSTLSLQPVYTFQSLIPVRVSGVFCKLWHMRYTEHKMPKTPKCVYIHTKSYAVAMWW